MSYLSMRRGDDRSLTITATEDLTGSDVAFTAKRRRRDTDADAVITKTTGAGIVIGNPGTTAEVAIDAADTDGLDDVPVALYWDVEVIDSADKRRTVATGRLGILPDISRGS